MSEDSKGAGSRRLAIGALFALGLAGVSMPPVARADAPGNPTAVKQDEQGMWLDKDGVPTYKVER